jgi:hypothetical protein
MKMKYAAVPLLLFALSAPIFASGSIDDVAWLAGHWTGTGLGGTCEETWAPPHDGVMLGTFRLAKEGKPVFDEFMVFGVVDGRLTLRLKHFNPDMKGWEEPEKFVEFRHVRTTETTVEFEGLRFVKEPDGGLTIALRLRREGVVSEELFRMKRGG